MNYPMPIKYTAQKMKFSVNDFINKRDQIRSFLRIWSHLLKKCLTFVQCNTHFQYLINPKTLQVEQN